MKLSWIVKKFNINKQIIEDCDVLKYREEIIKKLKKKCKNKEEFSEKLCHEFRWQYWSRAEYELIIQITDDNRIILIPWVGCHEPEKVEIDVTNDKSFDWRGFAEHHIDNQIFQNRAKIDIFDQLTYKNQFKKLVDYCWYTRLRYERDNLKFHD